jgi:glycosyltransferase involved in cell wall biosynthesis
MKHIVIDARIRRSSTGRYTDRLIQHLQDVDREHRYTVLVQPDDPWQPSNPDWTVVPCPYPQFSLNPLNELRFARQLRDLKPDLVHFTMTQQPLLYRGSKIITTTHDLTMLRFVRANTTPLPIFWVKRALYRVLFSAAHRKSDAIITPTEFVREDLGRLQPFTRPKTYVTLEASEPPLKAKSQKLAGAKEPFIFYVGSAFPHKNLFRLVDAFGILHERQPKLNLLIVGKREFYKKELEEYITKQPFSDSIQTPGFISDEELKWLYEHCAAYVFPSESEGFGLPGLEAMAHGAPVVSSNATCLPEVCGNAAEYFDPLDIEDIANAIERVITNDKLRAELIARGNKQIKKFSWRKMAEQTKTLYDRLLRS